MKKMFFRLSVDILAYIRTIFIRHRVILLIVGFTFLLSAGYAFCHRITPAVDASAYDQVGWNLAQGKGFRLQLNVPIQEDEVITYQGPFYQFFLAGVYTVFGHHIEAVWLIHAILRAVSVGLLYLICRRLLLGERGRYAGWVAGILFGFHPDLIEIGAMLMTETVFLFLMILTIYAFFRVFERVTYREIVFLSFVFAAAILARSTILFFAPVFLVRFLQLRAYKHILIFGLLMTILLTPWTARNYFTYGKVIPTMANFGYNLWVGNRIDSDGEGGNHPALFEAMKKYGMIEANNHSIQQYKIFVTEHPLRYLWLTLSRTLKYFSFMRPMGFWFYQHGLAQFIFIVSSMIGSLMLFVSSVAGWFATLRVDRKSSFKVLSVFVLLTCLSIVPIIFETRYRMPVYPLLALFGGIFWSGWWQERAVYVKYLRWSVLTCIFIAVASLGFDYQKIGIKLNELLA